MARARQRIGRYDRQARAAAEVGDWATVERMVELLDRAQVEHDRITASPPLDTSAGTATEPATVLANQSATVPATVAARYSPAASVDMTDDDLLLDWAGLGNDPVAQDQIMDTLSWRGDVRLSVDADLADRAAREAEAAAEADRAWLAALDAPADKASPLTNPARRPSRRLTPAQVCREEYNTYSAGAYLQAEADCRGHLLSRQGLAKGIDPASLFSGPASRVRAYASEELRTWFGRNGRITFAEWKFQWLGRESDRAAARTARYQSLGEMTA